MYVFVDLFTHVYDRHASTAAAGPRRPARESAGGKEVEVAAGMPPCHPRYHIYMAGALLRDKLRLINTSLLRESL